EVAEDCPAIQAEVPTANSDKKSVAAMQFELISRNPYRFTSDDVFFQVYAERNDLAESEHAEARQAFFSKGQPCFRASPLTKRYGWGVHSDKNGKVAVYGLGTEEYRKLVDDAGVKKIKAMRTAKK
ncbi:MAG: DUF6157 family protein, partial [Cytophagales bacterium]|nr:DUF6157 family protein [Cytophagales bacterium]